MLQNIFNKYFNELLSYLFSLNLCMYSCVQTPKKVSLLIFIEAFMLVIRAIEKWVYNLIHWSAIELSVVSTINGIEITS